MSLPTDPSKKKEGQGRGRGPGGASAATLAATHATLRNQRELRCEFRARAENSLGWSEWSDFAVVASALPTGQKVPAPHTRQSAALVITTPSCFVVPRGHGSAAAAPSAQ